MNMKARVSMDEKKNKIMPNFCCYKLIINFEQKHNFKYHDIIITITPSNQ